MVHIDGYFNFTLMVILHVYKFNHDYCHISLSYKYITPSPLPKVTNPVTTLLQFMPKA